MKRVAVALFLAAGIGLSGLAMTAPAVAASGSTVRATVSAPVAGHGSRIMASGSCETWFDSNTFGAACGGYSGQAYRAVAVCKNGVTVYGPWEDGTSWRWSYAYCTSVYSSLSYGGIQFGYYV